MAWIESHTDLAGHPKVYALSRTLSVPLPYAIGTLHLLWYFTLKYSWRDGDLSKYSDDIIARASGWDGDPKLFIESLQTSGFLDDKKVHDWHDFAGRLVKDRIRFEKANGKRTKSVRRPSGKRTSSVANLTVPNRTIPNLNNNVDSRFEAIWKRYPNRDGKKAAYRSFVASVKTDHDFIQINAALDNYLKSKPVMGGFIKNGSTWFNNWSDWIENKGETNVRKSGLDKLLDRSIREENGSGEMGEVSFMPRGVDKVEAM